MLERFTHPSYPHNWALIATIVEGGQEKEIGVARYASTESQGVAEFAIVVADEWQGLGIARQLFHELITVADRAGIECLEGIVMRENVKMLKLAKELGFAAQPDPHDATLERVIRNLAVADN